MKKQLEEFNKQKEEFLTQFKEWCKDKTIPLEERWELFIESGLGEIESYTTHLVGVDDNKYTFYDDFYIDRHQTFHYESIIETIEINKIEADLVYMKEFALDNFYKGGVFDW